MSLDKKKKNQDRAAAVAAAQAEQDLLKGTLNPMPPFRKLPFDPQAFRVLAAIDPFDPVSFGTQAQG